MVHDGFIRSMMFLPSTNHLTHQLSSCAMSQCGWGLHGIISHGHVSLASQVHLASCWTGAKSWKSKLISDAKNQVSESKGTSKSHVQHPTQKKRDLPRKDQKKAVGIVTLPEEVAPWMAANNRRNYLQRINLKPQTYHGFFCWAFRFQNAWHIGLCDCLSTDRFIPRSVGWKQPMVLGPILTWFHAIHAESHWRKASNEGNYVWISWDCCFWWKKRCKLMRNDGVLGNTPT